MAVNSKKNPTTYTYESVDGSKSTIKLGEDGVTYTFQNAVAKYTRCPDDESEHPIEKIPDPTADIFRVLYPDQVPDSVLLVKLRKAIEQLTDDQKDLILDLYGMCKTNVQVGKEKSVTEAAIRFRRDKIHKRIKKLMDA